MCEVRCATSADAGRVWELVGDIENWARVLPTLRQVVRLTGAGAIGVGDRFAVHVIGLPKAVYEITDWQPGRSFTWVASSSGVRTTAVHTLESRPGGTDLLLSLEWSGPLARLARLLVGPKARRMVELEAATFARRAEDVERPG